MKCFSQLHIVSCLLFHSFPIMPILSCCQAEEVDLSRQLICLVLSLALSPRSDTILCHCCDARIGRPWFGLKQTSKKTISLDTALKHVSHNDKLQWAATRTDGIWYSVPSLLWKVTPQGRLTVSDDKPKGGLTQRGNGRKSCLSTAPACHLTEFLTVEPLLNITWWLLQRKAV